MQIFADEFYSDDSVRRFPDLIDCYNCFDLPWPVIDIDDDDDLLLSEMWRLCFFDKGYAYLFWKDQRLTTLI